MRGTGWLVMSALMVSACNRATPGDVMAGRAIAVGVDGDGFTPASIQIAKGEVATLVFTRTTDRTCAKAVVMPELALERDLPLNTPVSVRVPTDVVRTLTFQCGMGMFKSSVVVK